SPPLHNLLSACILFSLFCFSSRSVDPRPLHSFPTRRSSDLLITNVRSSLMAVNIHITIIELNALHTKRQNLFQELDAVIHNGDKIGRAVQQECRDRSRMPSSA